jgi:hypothetical protein
LRAPWCAAAADGFAHAACPCSLHLALQIFERRDHPTKISSDAEDRAFVVGLNVRGRAALEKVRH